MYVHMGPPQLRVPCLSVVLCKLCLWELRMATIRRLNCLLWGNASPLTAPENDNRLAGSRDWLVYRRIWIVVLLKRNPIILTGHWAIMSWTEFRQTHAIFWGNVYYTALTAIKQWDRLGHSNVHNWVLYILCWSWKVQILVPWWVRQTNNVPFEIFSMLNRSHWASWDLRIRHVDGQIALRHLGRRPKHS